MHEELETLRVHAGYERVDPGSRARDVPLVANAGHGFEDAKEAAAVLASAREGNPSVPAGALSE